MGEPIEDAYFNWLCAKVLNQDSMMYVELFRILHATPFAWFVTGDSNRAEDGCELRTYFCQETRRMMYPGWFNQPCSVLEMMVALARNAAFQTNIKEKRWMIIFLSNLSLDVYKHVQHRDLPAIEEILNTFIWRLYDPSGQGGMFPLRGTNHDQRNVELWYQLSEYMEDSGLV